jgi:hypothetical protein
MADEPLISAEVAASFASMVTEVPDVPAAVPVAPAAEVPPVVAPPVVTPAAPAATPTATPAAGAPVTLENLIELQKQTLDAISKVSEPAAPVKAAPTGPSPERVALLAERQALIDEADNPAVARALKAGFEAQDKADATAARMDRMEQGQAEVKEYEATVQSLLDEGRSLIERFPGLTEPDMKKCFDAIAADQSPVRKSMWQVAEETLGFDYLSARRTPPRVPAGTPAAPPQRPPATIVDITGGGGGGSPGAPAGGGPGGAPPPQDVREVFAQILASPEDRAKLGKY